jgi:hypothetical protein
VYECRKQLLQVSQLQAPVPIQQTILVPIFVPPMVTSSCAKTIPKTFLDTNHPISHMDLDLTTYTQTFKEQKWRDVIAIELDALAKNNTWFLDHVSEATNIVGCK